VLFYKFKHQPIGRQIAFIRYFTANLMILGIVKVMTVRVENRVIPQPVWLMDLKIKTYRRHIPSYIKNQISNIKACPHESGDY